MQNNLRFLAVAVFGLLSAGALHADGVRYTLRGQFSANIPSGPFCAPNSRFAYTFLVAGSVPNYTPVNQPFFANAPIYNGTYAFNGTTTPFVAGNYFASNSGGNLQQVTLSGLPGVPVLGWTARGVGLFPLLGRPDAATGLSAFALSNLGGSVPITLNLVNGAGAALDVPVNAAFSAQAVPGATVSFVGSWPATVPVTPLCAANRQFLLEATVRTGARFRPGAFALPFLFGQYSFGGHVFAGGVGSYFTRADFASQEAIVLVTAQGGVAFYTTPPTHVPILVTNSGGFVSIPLGNFGAGTGWAAYLTPTGDPKPVNTVVNIANVTTVGF